MSLILDALRKMEQERRAKRQGAASIRAEVLNYRGGASPRTRSLLLPVLITIIAVSVIAAGLFLFSKSGEKVAATPSAVPQTAQKQPDSSPPLPAPAAAPQVATPQPVAAESSQVEKHAKVKPAVAAPLVKTSQPAVARKNGDSGITLSGIAWQDERHLRRAVINGFLVEEGGEVQGAKIVEIRENRVRFSKGGELFEIINSAGTSN